LAAEGKRVPVHVIKEVRDAQNNVKLSQLTKYKPQQTIDANIAKATNLALQQVVREGTGRRARELDRPAAGKTGTAGGLSVEKRRANFLCKCKKHKDGQDTLTSWWVGYTPQLSTAVLYRAGKEGESDLDKYSDDPAFFGGNWPTKTWLAFMDPAHESLPEEEFDEPDDDFMERTPTYTPTYTPTDPTTRDTPSASPSSPRSPRPSRSPTFPTLPTSPPTPPQTEPTKTRPTNKPTRPKPPFTIPPPPPPPPPTPMDPLPPQTPPRE
jgi:membrane peptidoglycan carboxypeptidase